MNQPKREREIMKTEPNDLAYPSENPPVFSGLSKREAFAMAAMQGLLSNPEDTDTSCESTAECAVEMADVLIAELNKEPN